MEDEEDSNTNTRRNRNPFARMFDSIMPNLGSIGGIFSFALWGLIFAGVAYFVLKHTGLGDKLPKEWQAGIEGFLNKMGISLFPNAAEEMLDQPDADLSELIEGNTELDAAQSTALAPVLREHRAAIGEAARAANNGHSNAQTLLNDKTVMQLLRTRPDVVQALITALPAPAAGANTPIPATILGPIKLLVNDRAALNGVLANADSRRVLASAILKFTGDKLPFKAGSEQVLADFIHTVGMNGGTEVTDDFVTFLGGLTTALEANDSAAMTKAAADYIALAIVNPQYSAQAKLLVKAIDADKIADEEIRNQIKRLQDDATFDTMAAVGADLGAAKAEEMQRVLNRGNNAEILAYMIDNPDARATLQANRETVERMASDAQRPALQFLLAANDAELRAGLRLTQGGVDVDQQRRVLDANHNGQFTPRELMVGLLNNPQLRAQWLRTENGQTVSNLGPLGDLLRQPQALSGLSASDRASVGFLTHVTDGKYNNLSAFYLLIDKLADNPNNSVNGKVKESTVRIIESLLTMAQNPNDQNLFKDVTVAQINAFFRDPKNHNAIAHFLNSIDASAYPTNSREYRVLTALKRNFGNGTNGLSEILRDEGGTRQFLENLRNPREEKTIMGMNFENAPGLALRAAGVDNSIVDNRAAVVNLMNAFEAAPAPTPRTQGTTNRAPAQ